MASLVAREEIHPALIDVLLQTATEVHGRPGLFQRAGEFPNARQVDFPLSAEAQRFYQSGRRFLQRYLPFWAATLVDRMLVLLIPLFALVIPLSRILPSLYGWQVRSRIYKWYGQLKFLEEASTSDPAARTARGVAEGARALEAHVHRVRTPLAYANQFYILREHIGLVEAKVRRRRARIRPPRPDRPASAMLPRTLGRYEIVSLVGARRCASSSAPLRRPQQALEELAVGVARQRLRAQVKKSGTL